MSDRQHNLVVARGVGGYWLVEALLEDLGAARPHFEAEKNNPSYHPGRCARVFVNGLEIGVFGQIHPQVAANYGVDAELYCAELSFDALLSVRAGVPVFRPLPRFPSTSRDIAVVCDREIPVGEMVETILAAGGEYLKDCKPFDVYTGSHVAEGKKSVAFSLTMRSDDQTLTDEHAEETVTRVLAALASRFNAGLR